jgi:hypothetical protein
VHFGAVAGDAQEMLNGKTVGNRFDIFLKFDLDATKAIVHGGTNELPVGVRKASLSMGKANPRRNLMDCHSLRQLNRS